MPERVFAVFCSVETFLSEVCISEEFLLYSKYTKQEQYCEFALLQLPINGFKTSHRALALCPKESPKIVGNILNRVMF